ncbi:Protein of unknown function [Bradyrhizobium erythrophlei]|nr:Protein of unknown function [Bradyrhizobium erythrophlei]
MHRSSETVAAIATALAKAQIELSNPEKSAVGLIPNLSRGEGERTFRYAPLSTGLELVRKSLGGHQIALLQTTEIDRPSGTVNLTTVLMHTSGEWISSDWPVCQLSDAAMPRRMGAALTYARRYSLFALVGIAGEDDTDLDAAEATAATSKINASRLAPVQMPARPTGQVVSAKPNLTIDQSATQREHLLSQIANWASLDVLQGEAIKVLREKNSLLTTDAKMIEAEFEARLAVLETESNTASSPDVQPPRTNIDETATKPRQSRRRPQNVSTGPSDKRPAVPVVPNQRVPKLSQQREIELRRSKIDKSLLAFGEIRRLRDKAHLRFVASQPCLICERTPSDPHHLRFAQPRAMGRKTSDEFVVPLCRMHHRQNHQTGDELSWWKTTAADPLRVARELWVSSRGIVDRAS